MVAAAQNQYKYTQSHPGIQWQDILSDETLIVTARALASLYKGAHAACSFTDCELIHKHHYLLVVFFWHVS